MQLETLTCLSLFLCRYLQARGHGKRHTVAMGNAEEVQDAQWKPRQRRSGLLTVMEKQPGSEMLQSPQHSHSALFSNVLLCQLEFVGIELKSTLVNLTSGNSTFHLIQIYWIITVRNRGKKLPMERKLVQFERESMLLRLM